MKVILQDRYLDYDNALSELGLSMLTNRREDICLSFAKSCLQNKRTLSWFPMKTEHDHNIRINEKYEVEYANTERFRMSSLPYLQRLLNQNM